MINFNTGHIESYTQSIADNTYDAVFGDPPYSLVRDPDPTELLTAWLSDRDHDWGQGFMGKAWDGIPGPATWRELLRVTKPGGYLAVFGGTRTEDWLSVACRLGGWQRFDRIEWLYSSGFPKSHNISKAIDKAAGAERDILAAAQNQRPNSNRGNGLAHGEYGKTWDITAPATDLAADWDGYGTALAPSHEPIILFRKPIDGTYANNAEAWGCGGINIEGTRIPITDGASMARNNRDGANGWKNSSGGQNSAAIHGEPSGRWPKNVIHDGSDEVTDLFPSTKPSVGNAINGSAARFFYCAKSSQSERHAGLDDIPANQRDHGRNADQPSQNGGDGNPYNRGSRPVKNSHPTVKPLELCQYIAQLLRPPAAYHDTARILIPFAGSGSEAIGAMLADWQHIDAVELLQEHVDIARLRAQYWMEQKQAFDRAQSQMPLFD